MIHKSATSKAIISLEAGILTVTIKKYDRTSVDSVKKRVRAACKLAGVLLRGDGEIESGDDWIAMFPPSYDSFPVYVYIETQDVELLPVE